MKWMLLSCLVLGLCMGQMCGQAPSSEPAFDRLAPNDHLRAACAGYTYNDIEIQSMLSAYEQDRLNGRSKNQEVADFQAACHIPGATPDMVITCTNCNWAFVNQVYDNAP